MLPLWAGAFKGFVDPKVVVDAVTRTGLLSFPGGVPTSTAMSGLQWDFPNAWPPLEWFVVLSLEAAGAHDQAQKLAETWLRSNLLAYSTHSGHMFEKYDVREAGKPGDGGEYEVVLGFGWTNGVVLDLLMRYHSI
jgi:alpha,alpha-trehalase